MLLRRKLICFCRTISMNGWNNDVYLHCALPQQLPAICFVLYLTVSKENISYTNVKADLSVCVTRKKPCAPCVSSWQRLIKCRHKVHVKVGYVTCHSSLTSTRLGTLCKLRWCRCVYTSLEPAVSHKDFSYTCHLTPTGFEPWCCGGTSCVFLLFILLLQRGASRKRGNYGVILRSVWLLMRLQYLMCWEWVRLIYQP